MPDLVKRKRELVDPKLRTSASQLEAAVMGFRDLFDRLRVSEPHWSVEETLRYVYENDDDFKMFYDKQPSTCRMIMDPRNSKEMLAEFVKLYRAHEQGLVDDNAVARRLTEGL